MHTFNYFLVSLFFSFVGAHQAIVKVSPHYCEGFESLMIVHPSNKDALRAKTAQTIYRKLTKCFPSHLSYVPVVFEGTRFKIKLKNVYQDHLWIEIGRTSSLQTYALVYDGYIAL